MPCKTDTIIGQLIQMGCGNLFLPVRAQIAITQIIGQDVNNIGNCLLRFCSGILGDTARKDQS
jgi:hypothetical protein